MSNKEVLRVILQNFESGKELDSKMIVKSKVAGNEKNSGCLTEDEKMNFPGKNFDIEKNQDSKVDEKQNIVIRRKIFKQLNKEQKSNDLDTSRYIPMKIKKITTEKTNGTCAYENCTRAIENFHHNIPFNLSKNHDDLVGLCKIHHEMAHQTEAQTDVWYRRYRHYN